MKVLIITEGGKRIGFGHITRCFSIYQAFGEKRIIPEFIVNGNLTAEGLPRIKRFQIFNWLKEKEKLFRLIEDADVAIIDSYLADLDIYKKISQLVKMPVYIDDNKRLKYPKGVVVNGTVYADELNYPKLKDTVYLLGTRYIPIRKEFWNVPRKRIKKRVTNVMVTFGGYDYKNATPKILKILSDNYKELTKNAVIGKGFGNIEKIRKNGDKGTKFIYSPDAELMKKTMLDSDIAISAGGQTLYELARIGLPTIGVCMADNQKRSLEGWQEIGFAEYAGWHDDNALFHKLLNAIDKISDYGERIKRSILGRSLVDGKGAERIVERLT